MCDPILVLVTLLKMRPHYSQSSRENATPFSGTFPLASYKEVPTPRNNLVLAVVLVFESKALYYKNTPTGISSSHRRPKLTLRERV